MLSNLSRSPRHSKFLQKNVTSFLYRNLVSLRNSRLWIDNNEKPVTWVWLRDSCQCEKCVHPSTKQKLHRSSDIPINIIPSQISLESNNIHLEWPESDGSSNGSSHNSVIPVHWLEQYASRLHSNTHHSPLKVVKKQIFWKADDLRSSQTLWANYSTLKSDTTLRKKAFRQLLSYGILFVKGVDKDRKDDANCELRHLAQVFGRIRDTFYGPVWDVKSISNSRNIAYTNLNLDLHMDLLYFESPPRFQILHALVHRVEGGTSIFVDAFERAETLKRTDLSSYDALVSNLVDFHYHNDGHILHQAHPTIELDRTGSYIQAINYSPPFQAPVPLDTPTELWNGLKAFSTLLEEPASRFEYTLQEGDAVIFDNRRVLHARTAFSSRNGAEGQIETNRWLKGCYLEADAVYDRARVLFS